MNIPRGQKVAISSHWTNPDGIGFDRATGASSLHSAPRPTSERPAPLLVTIFPGGREGAPAKAPKASIRESSTASQGPFISKYPEWSLYPMGLKAEKTPRDETAPPPDST